MDPYVTSTNQPSVGNYGPLAGGPGVLSLNPVTSPTNTSIKPVVTSSTAQQNLSDITTNKDKLVSGVQSQSQKNAQQAQWATVGAQNQAQYDKIVADSKQANQTAQDNITKQTAAITQATDALHSTGSIAPPGSEGLPSGATVGADNVIKDASGNTIGYSSNGVNYGVGGAPMNTQTTQSNSPDSSSYNSQLSANQDNRDQLTKNYTDQVNQIFQGVFPLNASQQAMVDSLKNSLTSAENAQKLVNANYEGVQNIANISSGRSRYAPEIAAGLVQNAVSSGIAKIQELDNAAASKLAELELGFQNNDLDVITKSYNAVIDNLDKKTAEIQKMQDTAMAAAKDAQDAKHQNLMDDLAVANSKLDQTKFDYQQQQDKIDQAFKDRQITLDEKKFLMDKQHTQIQDAIAQATFNAQYNFTGPNSTGSAKDIPGVMTTNQGISYFDPSQFSDPKQKAAAENIARQAGIAILDPKLDVPEMQNIDGALSNLSTLEKMFTELAPGNIPGEALGNKLENIGGGLLSHTGIYTTDRQAAIQAYNSNRDQLFKQIYALAGGHPRVNSVELQQAANAMPRLTITSMDTTKTGAQKLQLTRKYLYNAIKAIDPSANLPESGDKIYNSTEELLQAHPERTQDAANLANQGYSDGDIKVILNY